MDHLNDTFERFCQFGGSKSNLNLTQTESVMTNQKWAKFCKDCAVLQDGISTVDTDITFNRVKAKAERTINFDQFLEGLQQIAAKRFPTKSQEEAFETLMKIVLSSGGAPKLNKEGTLPINTGITARLTDTHLYTGVYKSKFDAEGHGLGKEGRTEKEPIGVLTLAQITNRSEADVRGVQKATR